MRRALTLLGLLFAAGCDPSIVSRATDWPAADALFQSDPRWVGGDGAETVPLGDGRTLWLFGDSGVSHGDHRERDGSSFLRNSLAIQTGTDPSTAFMAFYWGEQNGGPSSFIPEDGKLWHWPGQGVRLGDTLLLFYGVLAPDGDGYKGTRWKAYLVDDPDDEPSAWHPRELSVASPGPFNLGDAVLASGDHLYVTGTRNDDASHAVYLFRFPLEEARTADLSHLEAWCGAEGFGPSCTPEVVISDAAPEISILADPRGGGGFLEVESEGYGDTSLGVRSASKLEGPWSSPQTFYRPIESAAPDAFVYAGKAHAGLAGADLVITYVPSSFDPKNDDPTLYYPHFVRASLEDR